MSFDDQQASGRETRHADAERSYAYAERSHAYAERSHAYAERIEQDSSQGEEESPPRDNGERSEETADSEGLEHSQNEETGSEERNGVPYEDEDDEKAQLEQNAAEFFPLLYDDDFDPNEVPVFFKLITDIYLNIMHLYLLFIYLF